MKDHEMPRRSRLDLNTPAELAIRNAVNEVEKVGADPILTQIVQLLNGARDYLSDFVDGNTSRIDFNAIKTLGNTTAFQAKDNVKDIQFWGNGDAWKLLGKASSKNEGWMKSSKAMEIPNMGCLVQVTTQQDKNVAEAVTWVPGATIKEHKDADGKVIGRELVSLSSLQ